MSLALEFESKAAFQQKGQHQQVNSTSTIKQSPPAPFSNPPTATTNSVTSLRISEAEKQARYIKGECFRCGEKYGPGHRCKTGSLKLLEAGDHNVKVSMEGEEEEGDIAEVSLHAIVGMPYHPTLIVQGTINSAQVSVLVDCGSSYNFITDSLVPKLDLSVHEVIPFGVRIGNGDIIRCNHVCKNVVLLLSDLQVTQDFYPFSLGGADVVLGIQWLATLHTVQANWQEMFLKFTINGKHYKLEGAQPAGPQPATFKHLTLEPAWEYITRSASASSSTRLEGKSFLQVGRIDTNQGLVHRGAELIQQTWDGGKVVGYLGGGG